MRERGPLQAEEKYHVCKARRRTMREIAQGPLIPPDCAHFVAVVQQVRVKKRILTVDSSGQLRLSFSPLLCPLGVLPPGGRLCSSAVNPHRARVFFYLSTRPPFPPGRFGGCSEGIHCTPLNRVDCEGHPSSWTSREYPLYPSRK